MKIALFCLPFLVSAFVPAAAQDAPPPVAVAPPPIATVRTAMREIEQMPPVLFEVEVSGDGEQLWSGRMFVSANRGSRYSESMRAPAGECDRASGYPVLSRELQVDLSSYPRMREPDKFRLRVTWTRPTACEVNSSATVSFQQTVEIAPGTTQTVEGDGGLRILLKRRD